MLKLFATFLCGAALFLLSVTVLQTPADARRGFHGGGGHAMGHARAGRGYQGRTARVNRNVNARRNVNRNVTVNRTVNRNVNRRYVYRNGQRGYWRNGVWVVAPAVAAAGAGYVASCAYEYSRWQSTGSSYWRDRYYRCAN